MPNWCDNNLTITHDDPKMIKKLVKAWKADKFFGTIYPEPDYKTTPVAETYPEITAQFAKSEEERAKALANVPTIRADSWWDWRVQNWGTKWEISTQDTVDPQLSSDGKSMFVYFDSAWSPPIGIYEKLVEQGYGVEAYYFESGCAFCGAFNGDGDQCYSIDPPKGLSRHELADWFVKNIPNDILDQMDILNFYDCAHWQLEEEEEA